jgi:RecB family exonuclease
MSVSARQTRLHRVADLSGFRAALVDLVSRLAPADVADAFVLVPSRAAGEQLRRTLEDAALDRPGASMLVPGMGPRADLLAAFAARLDPAPRTLTGFEREVVLAAAARAAEAGGTPPPFRVRPGLVAEMLQVYDHVHRLGRTIDDFQRNFEMELERGVETDRGAERLMRQTAFLAATFRGYADRVAASGAVDEPALRRRLLDEPSPRPLTHVIVSIADRIAEADGMWPADFDLLTRIEGLRTIDVVASDAVLASGFIERLRAALPGMDEIDRRERAGAGPTLEVPRAPDASRQALMFVSRDREEELAAVARRLKADARRGDAPALDRIALVVRRPLPYLYLARETFGSAGIPFETLDTLPLAAEPYAAAVDLALNAVIADFSRRAIVALLRAPQFHFHVADADSLAASLPAFDAALAETRYQGGLDRLEALYESWSSIDAPSRREERCRRNALPAFGAALAAARRLAPLGQTGSVAAQIDALLDFLGTFDRSVTEGPEPLRLDANGVMRHQRVRAAVLGALGALGEAYRRHDPAADGDIVSLAAAVRRWLGARTFALRTGPPAVQIVDAEAARYGVFDVVQLVGVTSGEWPEPRRRTVLYPASMMALLEPAPTTPRDNVRRERDSVEGARAAFRDLLTLARQRVRVSSFLLENDAVVEPSTLIDEIPLAGLPIESVSEPALERIFLQEAMTADPPAPGVLPGLAAQWARARLEPRPDRARFEGAAGPWVLPRVSVSRLERYLDCPFRFFASEVLRLEEEPEDEDTRTPLERGRFLHELFEAFFAEWQRRGHGRITPATLPSARTLFEELCETALATLAPADAGLERARLLGSAVSAGIAHRVLAMEAERPVEVRERLLELPLQGDFVFHGEGDRTRTVTLSAVADRIDLLADGTLRVIDYKSKLTPDVKRALQLPIYSLCARTRLEGHDGRSWRLGEALYLSFEGDRAVVPLRVRGKTLDELIDAAQDRLLTTLDDIAAGSFPPRPARKSMCTACPYSAVCRLERIEPDDE